MRIERVEIRDFRCFSKYTCNLTSGANVLIGHNGAGKTTLIHAIHRALSFLFSNDRSLGSDFLSKGNNTLNVRSFHESDYHFDLERKEVAADVSVKAEAIYNGKRLSWELYRRNQPNATLYQSLYKNAFAAFMNEWREEGASLPLLAYYSDSYPHRYVKTVKYALDIVNNGAMPRNFGYYQWDEEAACTSLWETRICNCLNKIQPYYTLMSRVASDLYSLMEENEGGRSLEDNPEYKRLQMEEQRILDITSAPMEEVGFVEDYLKKFVSLLPGVMGTGREIDFFSASQTNDGFQLTLHLKNGETVLLQDLPAGYRRLYSIVFDMAYRSYILNGGREPEGIVIIDEIDLHLHPELEQRVVSCFMEVFPKVQFIVSTHSPLVITNLREKNGENQVLRMDIGAVSPSVVNDVYGLDYNTGIEDIMGVDARDVEIDNLLNTVTYFEVNGMKEQLKNVKALLLEKLGGNEKHMDDLLAKRKEEMGDEIHQ